jgi:hypothetical protein
MAGLVPAISFWTLANRLNGYRATYFAVARLLRENPLFGSNGTKSAGKEF